MTPKVFVRFKAAVRNPILTLKNYISDVADLQKVIAVNKPHNNDIQYCVTVWREDCVVDMDKKYKNISLYHQYDYIDGHPIIATDTDTKFEFIMPKILYPNDIRQYLWAQFGSTLNFKPDANLANTPLTFSVHNQSSVGLRSCVAGAPSIIEWKTVSYRPLSNKDTVVDTNLNQLWPENTGKLPIGLTQLFNQEKAR